MTLSPLIAVEHNPEDSTLKTDKEAIQWRRINDNQIDAYKESGEFRYSLNPETSANFLYGLFEKIIRSIFGNGVNLNLGSDLFNLIVTMIVIAGLVFAVIQLIKMSSSGLMERQSKKVVNANVQTDNIHEINFEKSIRDAVEKQQYRLVTRLYYLYALKVLSDANQLNWQPWKSNADYQAELKDQGIVPHFYTLGYYFEYIWYGNFEASSAVVEEVKTSFQQIFNSKQ